MKFLYQKKIFAVTDDMSSIADYLNDLAQEEGWESAAGMFLRNAARQIERVEHDIRNEVVNSETYKKVRK